MGTNPRSEIEGALGTDCHNDGDASQGEQRSNQRKGRRRLAVFPAEDRAVGLQLKQQIQQVPVQSKVASFHHLRLNLLSAKFHTQPTVAALLLLKSKHRNLAMPTCYADRCVRGRTLRGAQDDE